MCNLLLHQSLGNTPSAIFRLHGQGVDVILSRTRFVLHVLEVHLLVAFGEKGEGAEAHRMVVGTIVTETEANGLTAHPGNEGMAVAVEHILHAADFRHVGQEVVVRLTMKGTTDAPSHEHGVFRRCPPYFYLISHIGLLHGVRIFTLAAKVQSFSRSTNKSPPKKHILNINITFSSKSLFLSQEMPTFVPSLANNSIPFMIRNIFTFIFSAFLFSSVWAYDFTHPTPDGHNLYFTILSDTTVEVAALQSMSINNNHVDGDLEIPSSIVFDYQLYHIVGIGSQAFAYCSNMQSVTLPESVTYVGSNAFAHCAALSSVAVPDSVAVVGDSAFFDCSSLETVSLGTSLQSVGDYAFAGCKNLKSVQSAIGVESIGTFAFNDCSSLSDFIIPAGIKQIGARAFRGCSSLTSATLPYGMSVVEEGLFQNCSGLQFVLMSNGITEIKRLAFQHCTSLSAINLSSSLTTIGESAFQFCQSLKSLTFPSNLQKVSKSAFERCEALEKADFSASSLDEIEANAFAYCSSLWQLTFPEGVTRIGNSAFLSCSYLSQLELPEGVTELGINAFCSCANLNRADLPSTLTRINMGAFKFCTSLTRVKVKCQTPPETGTDLFYNDPLHILYVPQGTASVYAATSPWSSFSNIEEFEAEESSIDCISSDRREAPVYDLRGNQRSDDFNSLPAGYYVIDGQKVWKK